MQINMATMENSEDQMQARELVNVPVSKPDGLHSIPGTM